MIAEGCPERMEMPMVCWPWHEKKWDFPAKMNRSLLTYLPSQSVDCVRWTSCIQGPKSRKNQVVWHIEVQIHTITGGKNYGQVGNFGDGAVWWTIKQAENNWRSCKYLQVVSIHKFRVYKAVSRPGVDESSEWDFIKMILTKDQGRGKGNKKWMRIRKSKCVKSNWTRCCTGKFNMALSLCRVLGVALYFSESFLETAARVLAVAEAPRPLEETVVCFLE